MNKYLKILMLSGGLVGAIAPTAIDMDKKNNNDLGYIYENIEKMQQALPRLSRINYKLNINLDEPTDENTTDLNNNTAFENTLNEQVNDLPLNEDSDTNKTINNDSNISFTTTDNGVESELTNEETINYLNETLNQTNIEYEALKTTLSNAIKDTMDYLDAYKNGETTLTNEQKIYIKQHTNSIKFLAETLEDLSEDVICCIDGCEDCDDEEEFVSATSQYLTTINELETRINALNNAIASLQFINNISNPHFWAGRVGPNQMIYGYGDFADFTPNDSQNETDGSIEVEQSSNNDINTNDGVNNTQSTQDDAGEAVSESNTDKANNEDDKPTTFGLKSNIDTYAPTKRNIDTFFNTALYNRNEYMGGNYGYGYGAPYGGYGYMPYGQGYYGNPYGEMGLNSNMVNRETVENQENDLNDTPTQSNKKETKKSKKTRKKRVSNIDTYQGTTVQSNINSMGESKISKFFKEKFNNLRNKVRKQQDNNNNEDLNKNNNIPDTKFDNDLIEPNNIPNEVNNVDKSLNELDKNTTPNNNNLPKETSSIDKSPTIKQEKDIKAQ